jgi:hypothetical protein
MSFSSLATTLATLQGEQCNVELNLHFILSDMVDHVRNNLVLSLPEISQSIHELKFSFTATFQANNDSYCLRHFFPKHINLDQRASTVGFERLTKLSIKFESSRTNMFLDFGSIARQLPALIDISIIIPHSYKPNAFIR